MGQRVPGWIIDSTKCRQPAAARNSRWDTRAISSWKTEDGALSYTVVLKRPMNTGYSDDVALADSVRTRIGVFDNQRDMNLGSSNRGFSKDFWLIF